MVSGTTPGNIEYNGSLELFRDGNVFTGSFHSKEIGDRTCTGLIVDGRLVLGRSRRQTRPGIVRYTLAQSGDLEALWNNAGIEGLVATGRARHLGPEVLGGAPHLAGTRPITYFDVDGKALEPPDLSLTVLHEAPTYRLSWNDRSSGEALFSGVGLEITNGMVSAWDEASAYLELDVLIVTPRGDGPGQSAHPVWASSGSAGIGTEKINR
ncbi:MAG: hypothetical protein MPN21_01695 [Thermoanaerobaculia bacterium]|nr:hypothetical protein [Thermoanaerobaculia bacterium]